MSTPLRVLLCEDSENDAMLVLRELRRGGFDPEHERVDTAEAMEAALDNREWDIVLCDYSLPKFSMPAALSLHEQSGLDLPFIIVSGSIGEARAVAAMRTGAHDFVMKDNLTRLVPAIERELREAEERRNRRRAEEALEQAEMRRHGAARAAREQERKRLAEELHDDTLSALASVALELGSLAGRAGQIPKGAELKEFLIDLRHRVADTQERLRQMVQGIYPSILTNLGLVSALRSYLQDLSTRPIVNPNPLEIDFVATGFGEERLPEEIELGLYRVAQQGVVNTITHAKAKRLLVELVCTDSQVTLSVSDDGVGFDSSDVQETPETGHFGLTNLKDRIEGLQGIFQLESQVSGGTTVRATIATQTGTSRTSEVQTSRYVLGLQDAAQQLESSRT